jgi:hypothetical protein
MEQDRVRVEQHRARPTGLQHATPIPAHVLTHSGWQYRAEIALPVSKKKGRPEAPFPHHTLTA